MKKIVLCCLEKRKRSISSAPYYLRNYALEDEIIKSAYCFDILHFSTNASSDYIANKILSLNPEIVGFTTYLWNIIEVLKVADRLKEKNCNIKIILGGVEVSGQREKIFEINQSVDVIVFDEGERTFRKLLHGLLKETTSELQTIANIAYRDGDNIITNSENDFIMNLSEIPSIYLSPTNTMPLRPWQLMCISRGCPYRCSYCNWGLNSLKFFPIDRIIEELKYLLAQPIIETIYFCDSDILFSEEYSLKIFEVIMSCNSLNKKCLFDINPELITEKHIKLLSNAKKGVFCFHCAVHSKDLLFNRNVLNRNINNVKCKDAMDRLDKHTNVETSICFTYNFPSQTIDAIIETKTLSKDEILRMIVIMEAIVYIYNVIELRTSFNLLISNIKNHSPGRMYYKLARHLTDGGKTCWEKFANLKYDYVRYIKIMSSDYNIPITVFNECVAKVAKSSFERYGDRYGSATFQ